LPIQEAVGLMSVENSAGQIGLLGVATGNEVQLDSVSPKLSRSTSRFPARLRRRAHLMPGLTVRRAFRYADPNRPRRSRLRRSSRTCASKRRIPFRWEKIAVLAVNATVDITRASFSGSASSCRWL
jgi:hypothetical protein